MDNKQPSLFILIPGFPADENDTTCLPAQQLLIKAINASFPEIKIIVIAFQYPFINHQYYWYGNLVIPLNGQNKGKFRRLLIWRKAWLKLKELKKAANVVGIFSCWCTECALVGKYFASRHSLKHFIWICGQDARKANKMVKLIRPAQNSLIAISDFLQQEFYRSHRIKPLHVILIGLDKLMYQPLSQQQRDIDLIGVGSLIPLKQYGLFIEVVAVLKQKYPFIKTMICGEGVEKPALQRLIDKLDLKHNVLLAGNRPHNEIIQLMERSKILLHPSSYEGFGAVCMEALYAGAHVISFCKPLEKDITHWSIVATKEEMIEATLQIMDNPYEEYTPVLVNDVTTTAKMIMNLYGY